jgi:hypothetical protein
MGDELDSTKAQEQELEECKIETERMLGKAGH